MRNRRRTPALFAPGLVALLLAAFLPAAHAAPAGKSAGSGSDPLAAEIARWSAFVRDTTSSDELWGQIKPGSEIALARAQEALRDGRRLLALQRLASARANLSAFAYVHARPAADRENQARFEAEWTRMGGVLRANLSPPAPDSLSGVRPAAVRALAEAALPQVRVFYDASLEYARSTVAESGLFYIGTAVAQKEFEDLCRRISASPSAAAGARSEARRPAPPLRGLGTELDGLEADLLAAYRPPASLDRHSEFIAASATLKEARELEASGLRYGALLRYLQAALRVAPLRVAGPPAAAAAAETEAELSRLDARLSASGVDDTIGRLLLEGARADLTSPAPAPGGAGSAVPGAAAAVIARDVLPRYFAALTAAPAVTAKPAAEVTVTLVRWPYT